MTNRIRTDLEAEIAAKLPDNTTQSITSSALRSACTDLNDTIFREDAIALSDKTGRILLSDGSGYLLRDFSAVLPIPSSGLVTMLDGSIPTSFYSDIAKTTNSTEGGSVAVWEDQSGNGNDWTQSNASYQPLAQLSSKRLWNNGTGTDSASDHLVGPDISDWTEGTFFARFDAVTNLAGGIWGTADWSSSSSANHWLLGSHYIAFGTAGRGTTSSLGSALMTYEESISSASLVTALVDDVSKFSNIFGTPVAFRSAPYLGCAVRNSGPEYSVGGYFYKFCCYDRIITDPTERATINAWLES